MAFLRLNRRTLLVILTATVYRSKASIVINEVAYSGGGNACDESDWVELLNNGTETASLAGYVLYDDKGPEDPDSRVFDNATTIGAGEYLVLCRGDGFGFGIGGGDSITLLDEGGTASATGVMPGTGGDVSTYALFDGSYHYTSTPTPGATNVRSVPRPLQEVLEEQNRRGLDFFRLNDDGSPRPTDAFDEVVDLFIDLEQADMDYLVENPSFEQYVPFRTVRVESGGGNATVPRLSGRIRTKGLSTLAITACMGFQNTPFNIKFDEEFFGMRNAYLRNHLSDQSYIREYAIHRLNARFGLPFLRTRHVRFYLNGQYVGFYTMMEAPDQDYVMQRSFGPYDPTATGIFKFKSQALMCMAGFSDEELVATTSNPVPDPYYFERGEHRDKIPVLTDGDACLGFFIEQIMKDKSDVIKAYLAHNNDCAKASLEVGMVDLDFGPKSLKDPMEIFMKETFMKDNILEMSPTLPTLVDMDQWLRNLASYAVTLNMDSPINNMNNWYLATTNGGQADWKIVQYDHNSIAEGGTIGILCSTQCSARRVYWPLLRPSCKAVEDHPLLGPFFSVPQNVDTYLEYVGEFVELLSDDFFAEMRGHSSAIKAYVLKDPLNEQSAEDIDKHDISPGYDDYNNVHSPFVKTLMARKEQVVAQLKAIEAGTLPRNGKYGAEEVCPDWRDSEGTDYIPGDTFVPGETCPAALAFCKETAACFGGAWGMCLASGELDAACKEAQPCAVCFPYSRCGAGLPDTSSSFNTAVCGNEDVGCQEASSCFSHRSGQCAFDGELLTEECKLKAPCKPCYTGSRCGDFQASGAVDSGAVRVLPRLLFVTFAFSFLFS